ncbi:Pyruvate dehydrogenase E1 component subunit beta [Roseivivax sp. THAF40]|uniref:thiamine pyrophosphate-dependent enzyme n=1 Tax=unclassified Roseivivax TaxID=2639302 RepID=UPI001268D4DE|nr:MULTISPECIES: thiamine pyrophosphate-dependent enzyme [unclassified Roseivivax]QFS82970.1 Pyruvate dehydrogenase E1 component subunit beta [Roseivivax sp. THAF197b]QFT46741.1 Pyruvate dehydrogenase E1 component subunit beta [Roseivivax sp. THAF40]
MDAATRVHEQFLERVRARDLPETGDVRAGDAGLDLDGLLGLWRAQLVSRHMDRAGRWLQAQGQGFYTIGSSGHEGMAGVAGALRVEDPAFLHYRDGAFQTARSAQADIDAMRDMALSFAASSEDPISGGRHKVLGSKHLNIPPQTSTIASHLPKAVGAAFALGLNRRRGQPEDRLVMCSFGDASLNHSTAQGALNCAGWTAWQGAPLPLMFVCEDNGIGISTASPEGWVDAVLRARPGLSYTRVDGCDVVATHAAALRLAAEIRRTKRPGLLHLSCVRLYGHAGADVENAYRSEAEIAANEARDPLLYTARHLLHAGLEEPDILSSYEDVAAQCFQAAEHAMTRPHLESAAEVSAALIPPRRSVPHRNGPSPEARAETLGPVDLRAMEQKQPMNKLINLGLAELMLDVPEIIVAGEDVGRKGGVYGITKGLQSKFGQMRVMDTLLDEQSILGLAIGLGQQGYLPMPEIQFLAYLHNAEDQIRGEAATLPFFSNGQYSNPMVLRIAGLGYQKGFGGHFHNDNSLAVLRDIPGIIIGCPSDGADAVRMYREAVRLAQEEQSVVVMIEPIALYPMRDLMEPGDGGWMQHYPEPDETAPLSVPRVLGQGTDLAIVTYGNGVFLSEQARQDLDAQGISARIVDLRWLAPLDAEAIVAATEGCRQVLIVDECRRTGSQSEGLMTLFAEAGRTGVSRITAEDCFIATGPAYAATLPSRDGIVAAARALF